MFLFLSLAMGLAHGIEVNDQISVTLDGGERVDGWFIRAEAGAVLLHVPALGRTATVPVSVVQSVECNQERLALDRFRSEVQDAQLRYEAFLADPPPHPHPILVAAPSMIFAGTGHAMLGDWEFAKGTMLLDGVAMSVASIEAFGQQRAQVFYSAALISLILKTYSASDSIRRAQTRRRRLGVGRQVFEKSGS